MARKDHHPQVDAKLTYALKNRDREEFVTRLTPVTHGRFKNAIQFKGQWLNDTCWYWDTFDIAIEWNQAQAKYRKTKPCTPSTARKSPSKNTTTTASRSSANVSAKRRKKRK